MPATATLGPIEPHVVYPLSEFQSRVGWGRAAMRSARQNGLRVRYHHGRAFVKGEDFIAYLDSLDSPEQDAQ